MEKVDEAQYEAITDEFKVASVLHVAKEQFTELRDKNRITWHSLGEVRNS